MTDSNTDLDRLEDALASCLRVAKRPGYWEEFQRRAATDIDRPAAAILLLLERKPCQFQMLVNLLGIEAPSVSRKVHELENLGLIILQSASDRRVRMLALSDSGKDLSRRLKRAKRAVLGDVLAGWSTRERAQLINALEHLSVALSARFTTKGREKD